MNLSCLFHRWVAGRNSDCADGVVPASLSRHAETCNRCAIYTQRMRALDSRFRSVSGGGNEEFPEGLHAKITASVHRTRLEPAHAAAAAATQSDNENGRGIFYLLCGAGAAALLTFFALANPGIDESANQTPNEIAAIENPSGGVSPEEIAPENPLSDPDIKNEPRPTPTRRIAEFTGELPSYLVSKVSKPYESEMEFLADDLNAATDFLSACIFISDLPQPTTDL